MPATVISIVIGDNNLEELEKETEGTRDLKKNWDHSNHSTVEIDRNIVPVR